MSEISKKVKKKYEKWKTDMINSAAILDPQDQHHKLLFQLLEKHGDSINTLLRKDLGELELGQGLKDLAFVLKNYAYYLKGDQSEMKALFTKEMAAQLADTMQRIAKVKEPQDWHGPGDFDEVKEETYDYLDNLLMNHGIFAKGPYQRLLTALKDDPDFASGMDGFKGSDSYKKFIEMCSEKVYPGFYMPEHCRSKDRSDHY